MTPEPDAETMVAIVAAYALATRSPNGLAPVPTPPSNWHTAARIADATQSSAEALDTERLARRRRARPR